MGWPQIAMIVFMGVAIGISLAKNGEPKGNHSAGWTLFAVALEAWILYEGNFFSSISQ